MPSITCPQCAAKINVPDNRLGTHAPCPRCHETIALVLSQSDPVSTPSEKSKKAISRAHILIVGTGACIAGLIIGGFIGYQIGSPATPLISESDNAPVREEKLALGNSREKPKPESEQDKQPEAEQGEIANAPAPNPNRERIDRWLLSKGLQHSDIQKIGGTEVIFGWRSSRYYVSNNASDVFSNDPMTGRFFAVGYSSNGGDFTDPTAGFVPTDNGNESVHYSSSNEAIFKVYEDGSGGFDGPGAVKVSAQIAGATLTATVEVIEIPVASGRSSDGATNIRDVVKLLGIPDRNTKHSVLWPDSKTIDGIYYGPSVRGGIVSQHWEWDKYPGAVLSIVGNDVSGWVWAVSNKIEEND